MLPITKLLFVLQLFPFASALLYATKSEDVRVYTDISAVLRGTEGTTKSRKSELM